MTLYYGRKWIVLVWWSRWGKWGYQSWAPQAGGGASVYLGRVFVSWGHTGAYRRGVGR